MSSVTLPATGAVIATDTVAAEQLQRVKIAHGATGSATDASAAAPFPVEVRAANLAVTATGAAAAAVTLTLPAPGAGLFHYITSLRISIYATAARAGNATPIVVTSTNLPGPLAWTFQTAQAIGTIDRLDADITQPLRVSAANVATTIVCPATASVIWRVTALYYTGP